MESVSKQLEIIRSGTAEVLPRADLKSKLEKAARDNKSLNIKFGVDPTAPDLHLGHAVPLNKLRHFQDLGHTVTLIIGDFTALVGDPSGRKATRPQLSSEDIKKNAKTYTDQAYKILDMSRTKIVFNRQWFMKMNFAGVIKLAGNFTIARLLERDDFKKRYKENLHIGLHEFLYPTMQAFDSLEIKSDIEVGGTDQKFNMLAGRELQEKMGEEPQVVITLPILEGIDGVQKMSKSLGNHIGLTEPPEEIFGKVMHITDDLMIKYFRLCTRLTEQEILRIEKGLQSGQLHPAKQKRILAKKIVSIYYNEKEAQKAEDEFNRVFRDNKNPSEIPEVEIPESLLGKEGRVWMPKLIANKGIVSSTSEGRRLIQQGAVYLNDQKITDINFEFKPKCDDIVKVGKRKIFKIKYKKKK